VDKDIAVLTDTCRPFQALDAATENTYVAAGGVWVDTTGTLTSWQHLFCVKLCLGRHLESMTLYEQSGSAPSFNAFEMTKVLSFLKSKNNKMSSDMGSVPDPTTVPFVVVTHSLLVLSLMIICFICYYCQLFFTELL